MTTLFSHENIKHSVEEIDAIAKDVIAQNDYIHGPYYNNSLGIKTPKFLTKSFITDILKSFDPDECTFADHICTKYSHYAIHQGKQKAYTIYRCDQNNEFYIYVRHDDGVVYLFTCKCQ